MFRTLAFPSFHALGAVAVAFAMRIPRDKVHASEEMNKTSIHDRGSIGLLSTFDHIETSMYYSRKLDLKAAANLLSDEKYIYRSALENIGGDETKLDQYLSDILENKNKFIKKKIVWNRDKLKGSLKGIIDKHQGGTFACLLGGKRTGKSLVLHDLSKNHSENLFVVNLRKNPDVIRGILDVLDERHGPRFSDIKRFITSCLTGATATKNGHEIDVSESLRTLYDANKERLSLKELICGLIDNIPGVITIAIDEANIAFTLSNTTDEKKKNEIFRALALFTTLTKESRRLNVILVSGEHALPFRMSEDVNFNLFNMNKFIFAGEVSPKDMYTLLTTQWGVKHNLAMALISHYGGHIFDVELALEELKEEKYLFTPMDPLMTQCVTNCLDFKDIDKNHMIDMLKRLAIDGFVPLTSCYDPLARVISKFHVGGVATNKPYPIGLPTDVWQDNCNYGIVPSKQSMRLAIAEVLQHYENLEKMSK